MECRSGHSDGSARIEARVGCWLAEVPAIRSGRGRANIGTRRDPVISRDCRAAVPAALAPPMSRPLWCVSGSGSPAGRATRPTLSVFDFIDVVSGDRISSTREWCSGHSGVARRRRPEPSIVAAQAVRADERDTSCKVLATIGCTVSRSRDVRRAWCDSAWKLYSRHLFEHRRSAARPKPTGGVGLLTWDARVGVAENRKIALVSTRIHHN